MTKNLHCCSGVRFLLVIGALLFVATGFSLLQQPPTAVSMSESANAFLATLDKKQKSIAVMPYESEQRVQWHFIPKDSRKGLQIKHMSDKQEKAAIDLLRSALSQSGFDKFTQALSRAHQGTWIDHRFRQHSIKGRLNCIFYQALFQITDIMKGSINPFSRYK